MGRRVDQLRAGSTGCWGGVNGPHPGPPRAGLDQFESDVAAQCANTPGQAQATFSAAISSGVVTAAKITHGSCELSVVQRQDGAALARLPATAKPYSTQLHSLPPHYRL